MLHGSRQDGKRHADVRREPPLPGLRCGDRERSVVARLPQPRALFGRRHGLEGGCSFPAEDLAHRCDLVVATVELDEEARQLGVRRALVRVHRAEGRFVEQLAAGHGQPRADERNRGAAGRADVRERGANRHRALGQAVQAQRQLGDHAQRPFGADEERAEVVARGRLDGARARPDHRPVGEHDLEREHVRAHAAVADGRRSACVGRRHPAERRVGPGVDREPQAVLDHSRVELAAQHAGLRARLQVARQDLEHAVQPPKVDRDRAIRRDHVTFERSSRAERHDGNAVLVRPRERARDVFGRLREDDGRRRAARVVAEVAGVQVEH